MTACDCYLKSGDWNTIANIEFKCYGLYEE